MEKRITELFKKYLSNTCTAEEMEELFQYIRESGQDEPLQKLIRETYQSILNESEAYVDHTGELIIPAANEENKAAPEPARRAGKKSALRLLLAAGIITGIAFAMLYFYPSGPAAPAEAATRKTGMKKSSTERAEYKYILLPDSTQVWLNAGSTLEYPEHFGKEGREVSLSGEAYFDVKHAAEHPFLIHTGHILITVLGTAFNINAYPERSSVTVSVSRGKVRVSRNDVLVATLVKGQEVNVSDRDSSRVSQKNIEVSAVAQWQQGNLSYDDEPLQDIIADLERVYGAEIRIPDTAIRQLRISTRFRRELGVGQALEILCKLTDTQLFQKDGIYLIQ
jgi:ferric-dicitrate binding protein FerR (iron transport regulator)